jgi:hypothetical protein
MINLTALHNQRFFSYLSLFTFMMIILVTANNYLLMFLGWEGVGICSYLLVNFWFTRIAANQSSISAFLTNRVGDCFLTIGMFILLWSFGNIDYSIIFSLVPYLNQNIITLIGICLLIGAMAKSSQIGQNKALKKLRWDSSFFCTLIYAGKISNALESVGLLINNSPEKFQRQGINQQGINKLNYSFLKWFIGFSEGDGSFIINKGKSIFSIHLHIIDLSLLYIIKTELNMGNVYINKNSAIFIVKAKQDISILIEIFNGNLFLKKRQEQFKNWVINFNFKNKLNIELLNNNFKPSLNDEWLVGFIDAEGCFMVSISKAKIIQRFVLGQKNAEEEFIFISNLINGYTEKLKGYDRIVINYLKLDILIRYLNEFNLNSVKAESFDKWMEIYNYRKKKSASEIIDYNELKKKASLINLLSPHHKKENK